MHLIISKTNLVNENQLAEYTILEFLTGLTNYIISNWLDTKAFYFLLVGLWIFFNTK